MSMNRRGFLSGILAAAAAPAIVKAESIMKVNPVKVWAPDTGINLIKGEIGYIEGFRFIQSGGGHGDYYGNEVVIDHSLKWRPGDYAQASGRQRRAGQNVRTFFIEVPADVSKIWYESLIRSSR